MEVATGSYLHKGEPAFSEYKLGLSCPRMFSDIMYISALNRFFLAPQNLLALRSALRLFSANIFTLERIGY